MFIDAAINFTKIKNYQNIFEDVYIDTKTASVLDSNLNPIYETMYEIIYWWKGTLHGENLVNEELRAKAVVARFSAVKEEINTITQDDIDNAKVIDSSKQAIYAIHAHGWYPYGHLHDSLLRMYPWRDEKFSDPVVLCSKYNRIVDFPLHLKAFGYDESAIFRTGPQYRLIKVAKLYYGVNEARFWTTSTQEQYAWMLKRYLGLLDDETRDLPSIEGLYLSRNHVGRRGVTNNDEVESYLKYKGFLTLTGDEGLLEIISLFYRAKVIVGPHGSIFVNTIFCKEDTKIIEFCPDNRRDFSFKGKTKLAQNYNHILVDADENFNIEIDLAELERIL